jgi:hypothetical protein
MTHIEYLDRLPGVEIDISKVFDVIYRGKNLHHVPDNGYYGIFEAYDSLATLGQDIFNKPYNTRLHVMWPPRLPIHKDTNRYVAYNYIIDPGGDDVYTCFYDDNHNLISKTKIEVNRWHKLDVRTFHNVEGMTRPRIALTVYPSEKTNWPKPVEEIEFDWDINLLWQEYERLKSGPQPDYKFSKDGKTTKNTLSGLKVFGSQEYNKDTSSLLMQEAKRFCNHYGITDDIFAQFMWVDKDFNLSWHIDDATKCRSSVNIILTDDAAPVTFREGNFYYKCAALDVMQEHAVFNKDKERILMRISFRTLTHDKLVNDYVRNTHKI